MEKTLGEMLFEYRAKNHLSIKQVADMVGVSVATISNVERGHSTSRKTEHALLPAFCYNTVAAYRLYIRSPEKILLIFYLTYHSPFSA